MSEKQAKKKRKEGKERKIKQQIRISIFEDDTMEITGLNYDLNECLAQVRTAEDIIFSKWLEAAHENGFKKGEQKAMAMKEEESRIVTI